MPAQNGRDLTIDYETTTLVGVVTRGMSISNEYVDVTTDDDNGWRTLLANPGVRSMECTVSGMSDDEALMAAMMAANVAAGTVDISLPSSLGTPGGYSGDFLISAYEQTGETAGAVEFSATFMSTGHVVYTASTA